MRRAGVLAAALAALAAAGCGVGAGETPGGVKLTVTEGFGTRTLLDRAAPEVRGDETVMRLLQRNAEVETKYGGGFVHAIDGRAGGREDGRPVDWFYFVNGVLAGEGAASTDVRDGDRIWWDRHDWGATSKVAAVVGSFPEPFVHGIGGERLATRVECDDAVRAACDAVQERLKGLGLAVGRTSVGTGGGVENLRVIVGAWPEIRRDRAVGQIGRGPRSSGVYATLDDAGRTLTALDPAGRAARRLGAGTGLVAATRYREEAPAWVITGTDRAGVQAAARAFDESVLHEKFALAVGRDGLPVELPVVEGGP